MSHASEQDKTINTPDTLEELQKNTDKTTRCKKINFCIPLYNRGSDINLLLKNIDDIYNKIDKNLFNFKVIIGDYYSTDVNLNDIISKLNIDVTVIQIKGKFNLAKSLQICSDHVVNPNELLMHIDADTVFDNGPELFTRICNNVIQGISFYCPIVSTEGKPHLWRSNFWDWRNIYIPIEDHHGQGMILIYNSDYKKSNGFNNSDYINGRGEAWGGHEDVIINRLTFLSMHRPIESDIWLRKHERSPNDPWYAIGGSQHYL